MSGRFLLDTNIVIAIFAGEPAVLERAAAADEVFVPAVALGELYYGARKSVRAETNIARIDDLATSAAVLGCDAVTAQQYGRIKNDLRTKGRPIPENDIWVAAVAVQHGLTVVSRDDHFADVANLPREVMVTWRHGQHPAVGACTAGAAALKKSPVLQADPPCAG